jgi:DNA-binding IclR family transcriptional regulator
MHELSTRINQSCHLVVRSGNQGLVVLRQENQKRHANLSVRLGATLELVAGCSGQVLLAHMEEAEREAVLRSIRRPWPMSRARLDGIIARIAKRGYELQKSPMTAGVTDISYPVRGFDGKVVAALTVPYLHVLDHSLPTTVEQTRKILEEVARRVSQSLGWVR